jgi:hypothetical protein
MPRLADLNSHTIPGDSFGYSAVGIEKLQATEYTIVTIVRDVSGSVAAFKPELEKCTKAIAEACKFSKRADNLLIRLVDFSDSVTEVHGFKMLPDVKPDEYIDALQIGGMTALYEASANSIRATSDYAKKLVDQDYTCNALIVILTDGGNNQGGSVAEVKKALREATNDEKLESVVSILVGVNIQEPSLKQLLDDFHKDAGFTQFVDIGAATKEKLAKLATFVSKSISAQSQALGTNGPSKPLTF